MTCTFSTFRCTEHVPNRASFTQIYIHTLGFIHSASMKASRSRASLLPLFITLHALLAGDSKPHKENCHAIPLERRVLPAEPDTWRVASDRPLPKFYLHDSSGCNFSVVKRGLRAHIGERLAEEVVPIAFSQYLVDLPLIEALENHPMRVHDPEAAEWHVLAAMPFASRIWGLLEENVSADGLRCCDASGACSGCTHKTGTPTNLPGLRRHEERLSALISYLESNRWWRKARVPFFLFSTGISISVDLGTALIRTLNRRNSDVGPVILGGVDRSGLHAQQAHNLPLLRRMVVLPHVASPECTVHASLCSGDGSGGRRRSKRDARRALARAAATGRQTDGSPVLAAALVYGACRLQAAATASGDTAPAKGVDATGAAAIEHEAGAVGAGAAGALDSASLLVDPEQRQWWASVGATSGAGARALPDETWWRQSRPQARRLQSRPGAPPDETWRRRFVGRAASEDDGRAGFVFHGDHGRYDFGARGAVRDISQHLRAPHDFKGLRLMIHGGAQNKTVTRAAAHAAHRSTSRHTTRTMLDAALCFVPRGDTDTSRRLFDALATGCVPVVVKVVGGLPAHAMLSNLPFHHTISWRRIVHFLSAGGANIQTRHTAASGWRNVCRVEEAQLLDSWHDDVRTLATVRRNAIAAFVAALDVELHPRGVANALLMEMAYALTDRPTSLFLPPPHVLPTGMREWRNLSDKPWLWDACRSGCECGDQWCKDLACNVPADRPNDQKCRE